MKRRTRLGIAAVTVGGALIATSGLAYAGALPGAAQSTAAAALARVGVNVPGPNTHAGTHPDSRGNSGAHAANNGHGLAVSTLARMTTETGRDKGAAISTLASGGKSHAGNPPGKAKTSAAPNGNGSPNPGGNPNPAGGTPGKSGTSGGGVTTGATASSGHNSHGAATSTAASNGHSSAGSSNAGSHPHNH